MQNFEATVLFWLQPSYNTEEDLHKDNHFLQEIIKDTRIFYDRDQCIETLPSIIDQTIFLVLGPDQSDLIDILSTFTYLEYIYLQEPSYFPYTSQVRGVFPEIKQLLQQLKKDIKTVHNTYAHLTLSRNGELQQPQISTHNLQCRATEFKWIHLLFDVLLNAVRPSENIHKDLLDECRLIYRGNKAQTNFIDEFAAEYEPSKAIWWYTRDTFLYRLINMALRTENMTIIWKFRYIIQDIYQQLKSMHEKQKNTTIENQQQCRLMVYRSQCISTVELENLRKAEGAFIATTSFFSTTRNNEVALSFAGDGAKPMDQEAVMFEICIEQSDLGKQRPFADIRGISSKKDEDEILLCMGTVMCVESVKLGKDMTRIYLRTCLYNDETWQQSEMDFLPGGSFKADDEIYSLFKLGCVLLSMGEGEKAEQFFKMIKSSNDHTVNTSTVRLFLLIAKLKQKYICDADYRSHALMLSRELQKHSQLLLDRKSVPDLYRESYKLVAQNLANNVEMVYVKDLDTVSLVAFLQKYNEHLENLRKYAPLFGMPSWQIPCVKPMRLFSEYAEPTDEQTKSIVYDKLRLNMEKTLAENDQSRPTIFFIMAVSAEMDGNYDRAIALAREGLSMTCNYDSHVKLYELLAGIYEKQENWPAVIESSQNIIDIPQIAPSSPTIVKAHMARGHACAKFGDLSEAIISYTNALQLQDQHQTPNHPLTSEIHVKIGDVFEQTEDVSAALEYYHKAISCDFPKTSSKAYKMIGIIYMRRRNYDLARSNFMKCLEIQQNSMPHETFSLALTHILLGHVEHKSGSIHQRDFHIQQARTIADNNEDDREYIVQQISKISAETVPIIS